MEQTYNDIDTAGRQSFSLGLSVGLHVVILFLMMFNFSWTTNDFEKTPPAILMVDLSKVELGAKTNLPPEAKQKKETSKASAAKEAPQQKKAETKTPSVRKEAPKPKEQVKPTPKQTPKDAAKVTSSKKAEPVKKKETPKKSPVKPTPKSASTKATQSGSSGGLQSLLASVDKVKKPANPVKTDTPDDSGDVASYNGIKGGTGGNPMEALTISEKDLIANKIRECWNVNAGVQGAEEMIVELKAQINKDGSVRAVNIVNMKNDPVFRSMAESAKRAIFVCDRKGAESPFRILADKHPENYSSWKEIYLRMNPVDGGVF